MSTANQTIRAVSRAFRVLQTINRLQHPTLMEIQKETGLPYPTVYRIIQTLVHDGLVESEPGRKRYRPTELVLGLATGFQQDDRLVKVARPIMVELTDILKWPLTLAVRVGGRMMLKESTHALTTQTFANYYPGYTLPLQDCASGKAYLAFCSDEEREMICQHASFDDEEGAKLGFARLLLSSDAVIQQTRKNGFATHARNVHSDTPGKTSSISVPLFADDRLLGSLTVIFFAAAMPMQSAIDDYADPLARAAANIGHAYLEALGPQKE